MKDARTQFGLLHRVPCRFPRVDQIVRICSPVCRFSEILCHHAPGEKMSIFWASVTNYSLVIRADIRAGAMARGEENVTRVHLFPVNQVCERQGDLK